MKIGLYVGSWPQNIGNAFFDFGLTAIIKQAFPAAEIYYTGGAVHWMFNNVEELVQKNLLHKKRQTVKYSQNSFEIAQYANVDIVSVPGMCLTKEFVDNNGKTFLALAERKIPVIFVGAGGGDYNAEEANYFKTFLDKFYKYGIITRDNRTFDLFKEAGIENIKKGIDCAFFLPDNYTPPSLCLQSYNIENFDMTEVKPEINHEANVVLKTHHECWGQLNPKYVKEENTLISDIPYDYLTLYGNVNTTYSDRVHACIATLAYGNKARLYSETPRASLFEQLNAQSVLSEVTSLDMNLLKTKKEEQINNAKTMIEELLIGLNQ